MAEKEKTEKRPAKDVITPIAQMAMKNLGNPKLGRDGSTYLGRIFGQATMIKTKEGRNGDPYSYLVGQFRAITAIGEHISSEKLFLPGGVMEAVESQYKAGGEQPVEFAFDIFSNPDEASATGYRYAAKSLLKMETTDRVNAMAKELEGKAVPKSA